MTTTTSTTTNPVTYHYHYHQPPRHGTSRRQRHSRVNAPAVQLATLSSNAVWGRCACEEEQEPEPSEPPGRCSSSTVPSSFYDYYTKTHPWTTSR
uniref:Uncharacterized protein n=1 Tax=Lotharella oceanica TaxID=641309 RepID=A0A7S2TYW6_9EUKA